MKIVACRVCDFQDFGMILDYGEVALADSFLNSQSDIEKEKKYPLNLVICKNCKHVQIDEIVDPKLMFSNYPWETGISKSIEEFSNDMSEKLIKLFNIEKPSKPKVFEIASNDGSLLNVFKNKGCEILGVDPAENIAKKANEKLINTIPKFFNYNTAKEVVSQYGQYDICIARNVLAHVNKLHSLVEGIRLILKDDGFAVIEVPSLYAMVEQLQYDQVFHEHIGYHSLDSVIKLFEKYNMQVFDVESLWIHGGSLRIFIKHNDGPMLKSKNVNNFYNKEKSLGLFENSTWEKYAARVNSHRESLLNELNKIKKENKKIAIYGASGKGQSLLQFCGIDNTMVEYVVDKSKMKQGKLTPGTHIPVFSPDHIYEDLPEVILLCAWNFAEEIVAQERRFSSLNGRFLHPFPLPHYLD